MGLLDRNIGEPMDSNACPMGGYALPLGLSHINICWPMDSNVSPMGNGLGPMDCISDPHGQYSLSQGVMCICPWEDHR